jgi:hypothetical protein
MEDDQLSVSRAPVLVEIVVSSFVAIVLIKSPVCISTSSEDEALRAGSLRFRRNWRKLAHGVGDLATGADEIGNEPVIHVEGTFVLAPIPHVVTLRQDSPDLGAERESVSGSTWNTM